MPRKPPGIKDSNQKRPCQTTTAEKGTVVITLAQKPQQQALDRVDIATMTRYMQEGHFPPGSMLPKIIASLTFLEQGGKEVIITTPECLPAALRGETGTHIIKT